MTSKHWRTARRGRADSTFDARRVYKSDLGRLWKSAAKEIRREAMYAGGTSPRWHRVTTPRQPRPDNQIPRRPDLAAGPQEEQREDEASPRRRASAAASIRTQLE